MFKLASEEDLKQAFRSIDRDEVILPSEFRFPVLVKDYLTWIEPSGCRVYLVFTPEPSRPAAGIVFRRDQSGGSTGASMCEWCRSVRTGDGVTLLTAVASSKRRVGVNLCRDLSCKDKVRAGPGAHDFPSTMSTREKLVRITERMAEFARHQLF